MPKSSHNDFEIFHVPKNEIPAVIRIKTPVPLPDQLEAIEAALHGAVFAGPVYMYYIGDSYVRLANGLFDGTKLKLTEFRTEHVDASRSVRESVCAFFGEESAQGETQGEMPAGSQARQTHAESGITQDKST